MRPFKSMSRAHLTEEKKLLVLNLTMIKEMVNQRISIAFLVLIGHTPNSRPWAILKNMMDLGIINRLK